MAPSGVIILDTVLKVTTKKIVEQHAPQTNFDVMVGTASL